MQKFIENHLYNRSIISYLLLPFGIFNCLIQMIRRWIFETFDFLRYKPDIKIISVGNIVSGGSGKTPVTIFLAKLLTALGMEVAVSHRGYKGDFEHHCEIVSDKGQVCQTAYSAGDEAKLIAQKLPGVPVVVGENRKSAIRKLLSNFPSLQIVILDDSFQHLKVKHDLDIVVFNSVGGVGNGFVLPAGILREPLSALWYADCIVWNGSDEIPKAIRKRARTFLTMSYYIKRIYTKQGQIGIDDLKEERILLLSGIGQPRSFEQTAKRAGIEFSHHIIKPDHYDFRQEIFTEEIENNIKLYDATIILATEKDRTKLEDYEFSVPIGFVEIGLNLDKDAIMSIMKGNIL